MKKIDKCFALVTWKLEDSTKPLVKMMYKIPSIMSQFRMYVSRAQAKLTEGAVYVDAFVQHSIPIDDIKGNSEWILKENQMSVLNKTLQFESTMQMVWLHYSINSLDHKIYSCGEHLVIL